MLWWCYIQQNDIWTQIRYKCNIKQLKLWHDMRKTACAHSDGIFQLFLAATTEYAMNESLNSYSSDSFAYKKLACMETFNMTTMCNFDSDEFICSDDIMYNDAHGLSLIFEVLAGDKSQSISFAPVDAITAIAHQRKFIKFIHFKDSIHLSANSDDDISQTPSCKKIIVDNVDNEHKATDEQVEEKKIFVHAVEYVRKPQNISMNCKQDENTFCIFYNNDEISFYATSMSPHEVNFDFDAYCSIGKYPFVCILLLRPCVCIYVAFFFVFFATYSLQQAWKDI